MAYVSEAAVEEGRFRSVAEVAMALGVSRARMSQVMRRRWATVGDQECVLAKRSTSSPGIELRYSRRAADCLKYDGHASPVVKVEATARRH